MGTQPIHLATQLLSECQIAVSSINSFKALLTNSSSINASSILGRLTTMMLFALDYLDLLIHCWFVCSVFD